MADDRKRGRGRRNDIPWQAIREAYAVGDTETASLAKRFGCSERAIRNRRNAEKWPTNADLAKTAANNVISIKTRQAVEKVGAAVEEIVANGLLRHAEIETLLLDFAKDTIEAALGRRKHKNGNAHYLRQGTYTSEAGERKDAMTAACMAIEKSREIHGLRPGMPSTGDGNDDGRRRIVFEDVQDAETA
jgi:hypothetical protein